MAGNPSKDTMRQPLPTGGDQSSVQDLANQSFDPTFRTFIFQLMGRDASGTNLYPIGANSDGSISAGGLVPEKYTEIAATYPSGAVEVYAYKKGASTVATVTVTYSDSTKATLTSVVRT